MKETDIFSDAQLQTQTCFETAQTVCVPKQVSPQKCFCFTCIQPKGNAQFIFLCNPQKSSVNVFLMKILKSTVTIKVIVCLNNLGEENF